MFQLCSIYKILSRYINYLYNSIERSKISAGYRKVIMLNYQNNYLEHSNQLLKYQNFFKHCSLFLRFQQNYFDGPKLFSNLYPAKF